MHVLDYQRTDEIEELAGFKRLEEAFKKYHSHSKRRLLEGHPQIRKVLTEPIPMKEIETESAKLLTAGAISAAMVLSPAVPIPTEFISTESGEEEETETVAKGLDIQDVDVSLRKKSIALQLRRFLPSTVRRLTKDESAHVERILQSSLRIKAVSELDGIRLNTDYGYTGYEQHLLRFPGDTIDKHDEHKSAGIAPKKGAWGYFAESEEEMTEDSVLKEKYYFAVQTFLAPGWDSNVYGMKDWFKHRKMIMVNTVTGDAVVGVVADAGPGTHTGKQFGASPEAMHLDGGMRKGAVVMMFVDDPNDSVPLGPIFNAR